MTVAIVIPARYASTRLPAKMLLAETGWPLIRHTYEQAKKAKLAQRVVVATDDNRIFSAVKDFGGEVVMTSPSHPSGSDRLAEVAHSLPSDVELIINVQGDEPEIAPQAIDHLITVYQQGGADCATLVTPFQTSDGVGSPHDPNCVKAVLGAKGQALYFSRSLIPYPRDSVVEAKNYYLHLGIYAYSPQFLLKFVKLSEGILETREKLEQLRILEHGYKIFAGVIPQAHPGIDSPADYAAFVARHKKGML